MAYVGMLYNPRSQHDERAVEPHSVRYLAGFYELDELGLQLRRQAAQVGWDHAEQQIALSDGGNGLEEFFRKNFPRAECILDFWHAAEHLTELGLALYPDDESQRQERVGDWCHQLKHEGGASVLATLEQLELSEAVPPRPERHTPTVCVTFKTIGIAWTTHAIWPMVGRSAPARWKAPAKQWSPIDSKAAACVGAKTAPTPSATSVRCTSANPDNGNRSGKITQTNHKRDAHTRNNGSNWQWVARPEGSQDCAGACVMVVRICAWPP